jgi:phage-related tail protein
MVTCSRLAQQQAKIQAGDNALSNRMMTMENQSDLWEAAAEDTGSAKPAQDYVDIIGEGESLLETEEQRPYVDEIGQV